MPAAPFPGVRRLSLRRGLGPTPVLSASRQRLATNPTATLPIAAAGRQVRTCDSGFPGARPCGPRWAAGCLAVAMPASPFLEVSPLEQPNSGLPVALSRGLVESSHRSDLCSHPVTRVGGHSFDGSAPLRHPGAQQAAGPIRRRPSQRGPQRARLGCRCGTEGDRCRRTNRGAHRGRHLLPWLPGVQPTAR